MSWSFWTIANAIQSASALNGTEQAIGIAPALTNQIQAPNKVTDRGTIMIPIDGL